MATTTTPEASSIIPVRTKEDLLSTIALFKAYTEWLGIDLAFQDFATEISNMPGKYSPAAGGALYIAKNPQGEAIGCVALRALPQSAGHCEMKRLYVDPKGRGLGLGKALAETVIAEAKRLGYRAMLLDTLETMTQARALYRSLGFAEMEKYYETPIEGTVFLRLSLQP